MAKTVDSADDDDASAPAGGGIAPLIIKRSKVHKGDGLWLMSFSDMSLILMAFFILQLSFSSPDKRKYENVAAALDVQKGAKPAENLHTMERKLSEMVRDRKLDKVVDVKSDIHGLAIEFKDAVMFESGSAQSDPKSRKVVEGVLGLIAKTPGDYRLIIEGHTDEVLVNSGPFKSNWDLAAQRAMAMLELFKQRGVAEKRMAVMAYAHTRPKVAVKGLTGEALSKARAQNRRVVIRIE